MIGWLYVCLHGYGILTCCLFCFQEKLRDEIRETKYTSDNEHKWDGTGKPPLRISYFCVPYFKNRSGMNAPKNEDAKWKVDNGYLDLYTTRTRPCR